MNEKSFMPIPTHRPGLYRALPYDPWHNLDSSLRWNDGQGKTLPLRGKVRSHRIKGSIDLNRLKDICIDRFCASANLRMTVIDRIRAVLFGWYEDD
jgi:hypothetical protein